MLNEDRLTQVAGNPENHDPGAVTMAQEPLQLRRALGAPRAFVHPLGELYVEDGSHDLAGEPGGARRRLPVPSGEALTVAEPASPAAKQRGRSKKMSAQE